MVSYAFFTVVFVVFVRRVRKHEPQIWRSQGKPWYSDWRTLAGALAVSSVGILVRPASRLRTCRRADSRADPLVLSRRGGGARHVLPRDTHRMS